MSSYIRIKSDCKMKFELAIAFYFCICIVFIDYIQYNNMTTSNLIVNKKKRGPTTPGSGARARISSEIMQKLLGYKERTLKEYFRQSKRKMSNVDDVVSFIEEKLAS